jgi:hypothetical protein
MRLGDRPCDEEAESRARLRASTGVHAPELLEDEAALVGRDAGPVVDHRHVDVTVVGPGPNLDLVAGHRVLGRVRDEVEQELTEALPVAPHGRQRIAHLRHDLHLVVSELDQRRRFAHELGQVDVREDVRKRARLDPRRVEHVADQRRKAIGLLLDEREEGLALVRRELAPAPAESDRAADHGRHRGL